MSTAHLHVTPLTDYARTPAVAPVKTALVTSAERRMRRGKRLVISGFAVTVTGIIGYCLACFGAAVNPAPGSLEDAAWFVTPSLAVLGLGTLLWLVGSFLFLSGAMDSDPERPDLQF